MVEVDLGAPVVAELLADFQQLGADHREQPFRAGEDIRQVGNHQQELAVFVDDLVALEPGQALQAQIEDRLGLNFGEPVDRGRRANAGLQAEFRGQPLGTRADVTGPGEHLGHRARTPDTGHQGGLGFRRCRCAPDELDHLVEVAERDGLALEHVRTVAGPLELEHGAPGHDLAAVPDEALEQLLQAEQSRLAIDQRDHVDAEHGLERRVLVEVVEDDLGDFTALEFDDDAHAVLVGLVAQLADALDLLVAHEVGDALQEARLVHLIGQLGDDDRLPALVHFLDVGAAADVQAAAARRVGGTDLGSAVDDAGGRKIRTRHDAHQLTERDLGAVDQGDAGIDHFAQVVRRDVGRHADRDARGAVDQQVRHARRQHRRFRLGFVVVRREVDRILVDVRKQLMGDARHAHLGIAHGGRRVAVDRAEVALAVDEQVAHRERLRHAHDRVVHGRVAVRMILADDVADDTGRLLVGLVPVVGQLVHGVQHAPVHRLKAVANVGQSAADDDAHGVVEIRLAHLVFEVDVEDFAGDFGH